MDAIAAAKLAAPFAVGIASIGPAIGISLFQQCCPPTRSTKQPDALLLHYPRGCGIAGFVRLRVVLPHLQRILWVI